MKEIKKSTQIVLALIISLFYTFVTLFFTGWIQIYGHWFSPYLAYRFQTDALLQGQLKLSDNVLHLDHDLTWSMQGVHQVWGLGIPLWRLPFEILAFIFGFDAFPDRISFGLFLFFTAFLIVKLFVLKIFLKFENTHIIYFALTLSLLFPPFISLMKTRGGIWEEAIAYQYLYSLLLLVILFRIYERPAVIKYIVLCAVSGIGGLIRPTALFYGFSSVIIASFFLFKGSNRQLLSQKKIIICFIIGIFTYLIGLALLLATNYIRFGSSTEFGHSLNLQSLTGSMYSTKFDCPYQSESFINSAIELFGLLFLANERYNGDNWYQNNIFDGQSTTSRFREIYFRTYDLSYFLLLIVNISIFLYLKFKSPKPKLAKCLQDKCYFNEVQRYQIVTIWSTLSAIPLLYFYMNTPVISSRYMLDFAPAFAVMAISAWLLLINLSQNLVVKTIAFISFFIWFGTQFLLIESNYGPPSGMRYKSMYYLKRSFQHKSQINSIDQLKNIDAKVGNNNIPFNLTGWNLGVNNVNDTSSILGSVSSIVIVFMKDIEFIELKIAPLNNLDITPSINHIRIKVGLEQLALHNYVETPDGYTVLFKKPTNQKWCEGIQVVFISFVSNIYYSENHAPWILESIKCSN